MKGGKTVELFLSHSAIFPHGIHFFLRFLSKEIGYCLFEVIQSLIALYSSHHIKDVNLSII